MGKAVWKALAMITQIGISMMVPIFLCLFLGIKLDQWFNTNWVVLIFLILGIAAAFRNVYHMTRTFYAKDKTKEEAELNYYEDLRKEREKNLSSPSSEIKKGEPDSSGMNKKKFGAAFHSGRKKDL